MNRHNFVGHLALALALVMVAAFAGQLRRMSVERKTYTCNVKSARAFLTPPPFIALPVERGSEVLVKFRPSTKLETISAILARLNDRLEDRIESVNGLAVIADEDGLPAEAVAEEYRALAEVEYAEPNFLMSLDPIEKSVGVDEPVDEAEPLNGAPDDPMFADQWSLSNEGQRSGTPKADIRALNAWASTTGTQEIVVAVLDSGVDYTHLDLAANMWVRSDKTAAYRDDQLGEINDIHGFDAVQHDGDPMDDNGHGTHCAGIIGAKGNNHQGIAGVNWQVKIMPLKFMSAGGFGTTKDAIECINYVIDRKRAGVNVRVISASWGSTQKSKALEDAIRKAGEAGILFVAASGNASANTDRVPHYPSSYNLPNVISVAALNRRDELASFSNFGPKSVHLAAPGAEILSTWLGSSYEEHSGTSMATPIVSGVAALVLSVDGDLSVKELRERLFSSVDKLDGLKGKIVTGGRVNAARALRAD